MFTRSRWILTCFTLGITLAASRSLRRQGRRCRTHVHQRRRSVAKQSRAPTIKGKYVVLEWHNRDCPYVKKHYASGNMQKLQKEWTQKGVAYGSRWFLRPPASRATATPRASPRK